MLGFVRHLPKWGWESVVVAPPRMPWEPVDEQLCKKMSGEVRVHYVPYPMGRLMKPLRWLMPISIWLPLALPECFRAIRAHRPDAVFTSGPPHDAHLLGLALQRLCKIPWVADFRDPWVTHGSRAKRRPVWRLLEPHWEGAVIRRADAVVANTPMVRDALKSAYPRQAGKVVAITNGYDPEDFDSAPEPPRSGQGISIIHSGSIYCGRDPRPFLDALKDLNENPRGGEGIIARFYGRAERGPDGSDLEAEIHSRALDRYVDLEGQVPYEEALRAMKQADILLLLDTPGRRLGVPAKLYEYLGARRPILALAEGDGDVAWVLRQSHTPHRITGTDDVTRIKKAVIDLVRESRGQPVPKPNGELQPFTRERMAQQLADVLNRCRR
jgi:glycosyltransferase involved in cell wall biosynthesis